MRIVNYETQNLKEIQLFLCDDTKNYSIMAQGTASCVRFAVSWAAMLRRPGENTVYM